MCPDCEIKNQLSKITAETVLEQADKIKYIEGFTSSDEIFEKRMKICENCPSFVSKMMCRENGFYSAFKAKILSAKCPKNLWDFL